MAAETQRALGSCCCDLVLCVYNTELDWKVVGAWKLVDVDVGEVTFSSSDEDSQTVCFLASEEAIPFFPNSHKTFQHLNMGLKWSLGELQLLSSALVYFILRR